MKEIYARREMGGWIYRRIDDGPGMRDDESQCWKEAWSRGSVRQLRREIALLAECEW